MTTYRNPWHRANDRHSGPEFYSTNVCPVSYKGFQLFQRIHGCPGRAVWDIVKDGVCKAQYAGPNGARGYVDKLLA